MSHHQDHTAASGGARRSSLGRLWIIKPWPDLFLFVATPALILPLFATARSRWSLEEITLFVFAFGQLGHNLPGMMRAYGDRTLFQQHKIRFLVAPLGIMLTSWLFVRWNLHGLILISAVWGIWHALMQTYGLVRIYDAKVRCYARSTQRIDLAMCICWFGLAVVLSPGRLMTLLDLFFVSGGPLFVAPFINGLAAMWCVATAVVTAIFLVHLVRGWWWDRSPPNPVKLLLMAISFGFFCYSNLAVSNVLLGLAMFEVFHDVQYLAIVWIYNRNRVEKGERVGSFTSFLFRRSGALIGLYLGLICAYGSLHYLEHWLQAGRMKDILTAMLATSGLLHYYFDGFIWKIRDKSTRESLQLAEGRVEQQRARSLAPWMTHALKWTMFVAPVCWLGVAELTGVAPESARLQALREAVPNSPVARVNLGTALHLQGDTDQALQEYREAIKIDSQCWKALNNYGLILVSRGEIDRGLACYQKALRANPSCVDTHNNLGAVLVNQGKLSEAEDHFRCALQADPTNLVACNHLAVMFAKSGMYQEAESQFRRAIDIDPHDSTTHYNFGIMLAKQRRLSSAAHHFREALASDPQNSAARQRLARIRMIEQREAGRTIP